MEVEGAAVKVEYYLPGEKGEKPSQMRVMGCRDRSLRICSWNHSIFR
jgi:hypothetical protein